jgi:hypothetical protein
MNMNREAVDAALGYAGNMPMTDDDKKYKNLVYVFCKNLYLPTLFNSLCEIDWRCARKYAALHETRRYTIREPGKYYYETPADCIRPLFVDDNIPNFRNDTNFIITDMPASKLYYVFHKRKIRGDIPVYLPADIKHYDALPYISDTHLCIDGKDPAAVIKVRPDNPAVDETEEDDDDFPEWEYTPYDEDVWQYFSYRLAARLVPKLRADDGAAVRAQTLEGLARNIGEQAIERSRAAASNPAQPTRLWAELAGVSTGGRYQSEYPAFRGRV